MTTYLQVSALRKPEASACAPRVPVAISAPATHTQSHPLCREQATAYREEEAKRLRKVAWLQGLFGLTLFAGPVFVSIAAFAAYELSGNNLTVAKAYTSIAFFNLLRIPMGFLPQVWVASQRCCSVQSSVLCGPGSSSHAVLQPAVTSGRRMCSIQALFSWLFTSHVL